MIVSVSSWNSGVNNKSLGLFIEKQLKSIDEKVIHITINKIPRRRIFREGSIIYFNIYNDIGSPLIDSFCKVILYNYYLYYLCKVKYTYNSYLLINILFHIGVFVFPFIALTNICYSINEHWSGYLKEDGSYEKKPVLIRWIISWLVKGSQCISVPSPYLKNRIVDLFSVNQGNVYVIPNDISLSQVSSVIKNSPKEFLSFFVIGNVLDLNKNARALFHLDRILSQLNILDYSFCVIGKYDEKDSDLLYLKKTTIVHNVDNMMISRYFEQYTYLNLSAFETFSISVAHSVMMNMHTLVTNSGGPLTFLDNKLVSLLERDNYFSYLGEMLWSERRFIGLNRDIKESFLKLNIDKISDFSTLGEFLRYR